MKFMCGKGLWSFILVISISSLVAYLHTSYSVTGSLTSIDSKNTNFEPEIIESFENAKDISVIVMLKDYSNITISPKDSVEKRYANLERKVEFSKNVQRALLNEIPETELRVTNRYFTINGFAGKITKTGFEILRENPNVEFIYLNREIHTTLFNSVPLINADDVWSEQVNGVNITGGVGNTTVCIIDSGINSTHPDLANKVVGGYCFCHVTDYGSGGCCPNNASTDTDTTDDFGHGTVVSGVVAANGDEKGVAPDAKLVALKVCNATGSCYNSDIISAIEWCYNNRSLYNISVISMSLGDYKVYTDANCSTEGKNAIDTATNLGIFIGASSGNEGYLGGISWPACSPNVTSVGSTYDYNFGPPMEWCLRNNCSINCTDDPANEDEISCFTNRGENLDLLAPGSAISSVSGYETGSGTSMAIPHVTGAAALLIQYEILKNNRILAPIEIRNRFIDTGELIHDTGEYSTAGGTNLTFSRIDVHAALFPIDVQDFKRVEASNTHNVFFFKIKNNYNNKTKAVNWTFDIGNGTIVTSDTDAILSPKEDLWVFFEENYTDGDIYNVKATAASGSVSDTEEMTLTLGDIIAYDMKEIYSNGVQRVFFFKILNNMDSPQLVNWTFYTGDSGEEVHADTLALLQPDEDIWVFFENNYSTSDTYYVRAKAFNVNSTDYTETITVNVGEPGSPPEIGNYTMEEIEYNWEEDCADYALDASAWDDSVWQMNADFDVPFYNHTYTNARLWVDSNGRISMESVSSKYDPDDGDFMANPQIATNWIDLYGQANEGVFACNRTDASGGKYVVIQSNGSWYLSPDINTQTIIYENGTIRINYGFMSNGTAAGGTGASPPDVYLGVSNGDGEYFTWDNWDNRYENRSYSSYNFIPE